MHLYSSTSLDALLGPLCAVRRRMRLQALLDGGARAALPAAVVALGGAAAARAGWPRVGLAALAGMAVVVATGAAWAAARRIPLALVARRVDERHGLAGRMQAALDFASRDAPTRFMRAAIDDALDSARRVGASSTMARLASPLRRPDGLRGAAALGAIAALLLVVPLPAAERAADGGPSASTVGTGAAGRPDKQASHTPREAPESIASVLLAPERAAAAELLAEELAAGDTDLARTPEQLLQLFDALDRRQLSRRQALDRLGALEVEAARDRDAWRAELRGAGEALEKAGLTRALGRALRRGDTAEARREIERLRSSSSRAQREAETQLAAALRKIRDQVQQANPKAGAGDTRTASSTAGEASQAGGAPRGSQDGAHSDGTEMGSGSGSGGGGSAAASAAPAGERSGGRDGTGDTGSAGRDSTSDARGAGRDGAGDARVGGGDAPGGGRDGAGAARGACGDARGAGRDGAGDARGAGSDGTAGAQAAGRDGTGGTQASGRDATRDARAAGRDGTGGTQASGRDATRDARAAGRDGTGGTQASGRDATRDARAAGRGGTGGTQASGRDATRDAQAAGRDGTGGTQASGRDATRDARAAGRDGTGGTQASGRDATRDAQAAGRDGTGGTEASGRDATRDAQAAGRDGTGGTEASGRDATRDARTGGRDDTGGSQGPGRSGTAGAQAAGRDGTQGPGRDATGDTHAAGRDGAGDGRGAGRDGAGDEQGAKRDVGTDARTGARDTKAAGRHDARGAGAGPSLSDAAERGATALLEALVRRRDEAGRGRDLVWETREVLRRSGTAAAAPTTSAARAAGESQAAGGPRVADGRAKNPPPHAARPNDGERSDDGSSAPAGGGDGKRTNDGTRDGRDEAQARGRRPDRNATGERGSLDDFLARSGDSRGAAQKPQPSPASDSTKPSAADDRGGERGDDRRGSVPWGDEHDPELFGDPTHLDAKHRAEHVSGRGGVPGPSRAETILRSSRRGFSGQAYRRVFTDYTAVADEFMAATEVPPGYRFFVERYFRLIRPRP